jgi:hypothetical protein
VSEIIPPNSRNHGIDLSVVIAVWPNLDGLAECLDSLTSQRDTATEILVVSEAPVPTKIRSRSPWVQWLESSPNMLVPHLWSIGMGSSRGRIVAITTARFVPARDWLKNICESHRRLASAGIGGIIDPPCGHSAKDWAIYFLRYSAYLNYTREQIVPEIAGDNASYKRDSLVTHRDTIAEGFWEPDFHRVLRAEGKTLSFVPAIRVTQGAPFGVRCFCMQRFQHGRHFGRMRLRGSSAPIRIARVVTSPLIPVVLLAKIFRRVMASRRYFGRLLFSFPLLFVFVVAWTLGEIFGYCAPGSAALEPKHRPQSPG